MERVNLEIHDVLQIKNAIQYIRAKTQHLGENYDFRKHGVNPLYEEIVQKCELIESILAGQSIKFHPPKQFKVEDINAPINQNYIGLNKRKKKDAILRNQETNEWWIPFPLIPLALNIPGEIAVQDFERFIFKRNRTQYLYLKMEEKNYATNQ